MNKPKNNHNSNNLSDGNNNLESSISSNNYNPQNEKIVFCKTKRTIPQNEAYPEKSFFDAVEYNKSTLKVAFVSLHDICDTQAATSLVVGSV